MSTQTSLRSKVQIVLQTTKSEDEHTAAVITAVVVIVALLLGSLIYCLWKRRRRGVAVIGGELPHWPEEDEDAGAPAKSGSTNAKRGSVSTESLRDVNARRSSEDGTTAPAAAAAASKASSKGASQPVVTPGRSLYEAETSRSAPIWRDHGGWQQYYDASGNLYYYNHLTDQSQWDPPEEY